MRYAAIINRKIRRAGVYRKLNNFVVTIQQTSYIKRPIFSFGVVVSKFVIVFDNSFILHISTFTGVQRTFVCLL